MEGQKENDFSSDNQIDLLSMNELASPWTVGITGVSHFCCFNSGFCTSVKALTVVSFL